MQGGGDTFRSLFSPRTSSGLSMRSQRARRTLSRGRVITPVGSEAGRHMSFADTVGRRSVLYRGWFFVMQASSPCTGNHGGGSGRQMPCLIGKRYQFDDGCWW